ncbi:hypothetical protein KIN20_022509 [Parelaphostrongylus tenuis]|uniref:Uncharacterized protein n=1 Tax=Parelaphostrongylus tenuis TaxID=148309 RepID=A0AAD5MVM4_PARTN|nr:hypothetical protein KIN20_022509 [Parelaphostrongylus tenuis]
MAKNKKKSNSRNHLFMLGSCGGPQHYPSSLCCGDSGARDGWVQSEHGCWLRVPKRDLKKISVAASTAP